MEPHSAREIIGGFEGGPSTSGGGSEMGVDVGVLVGVLVAVGGTGVAVGGTGVGESVGVAVGVEMLYGDGLAGAAVAVSAPEPSTAGGTGRLSLRSRATRIPATKLRAGTSIQPLPPLQPSIRRHRSSS
jgi:hypothetical protein